MRITLQSPEIALIQINAVVPRSCPIAPDALSVGAE
jgi:hypothetical protein